MNRATIYIFASVLAAGCSASYNGERLFWNIQHRYGVVLKDPGAAPPAQLSEAVSAFERVAQRARGTVWAARADLVIGTLYARRREYAKARDAYTRVLRDYDDQRAMCLVARVALAKLSEDEQHWDAAAQMYEEIARYHPWTMAGMEAPLAVLRLSRQQPGPDRAAAAADRAAGRYTQLIADAPTPELQLRAKGYLALVYEQQWKWDREIPLLEELAGAPSGVNRPLVLLKLGAVYAQAGNAQQAQAAYERVMREFPGQPAGTMARLQLERLLSSSAPASVSSSPAPGAVP